MEAKVTSLSYDISYFYYFSINERYSKNIIRLNVSSLPNICVCFYVTITKVSYLGKNCLVSSKETIHPSLIMEGENRLNEIISNILKKLPVKSLIRLQCL